VASAAAKRGTTAEQDKASAAKASAVDGPVFLPDTRVQVVDGGALGTVVFIERDRGQPNSYAVKMDDGGAVERFRERRCARRRPLPRPTLLPNLN
jgi:3D (Asp-Asp-Asp) domain-containing protein